MFFTIQCTLVTGFGTQMKIYLNQDNDKISKIYLVCKDFIIGTERKLPAHNHNLLRIYYKRAEKKITLYDEWGWERFTWVWRVNHVKKYVLLL